MNSQQQANTTLPTKVAQRHFADTAVRFGEGFIAPKIALHHRNQVKLPETISKRLNEAAPTVRFGEGFIAPKIAMHHSREIK